MSKRDFRSRLKSRLDDWDTYSGEAVTSPLTEQATSETVTEDNFAVVYDSSADETNYSDGVVPDARVAELQAALEHERDKARRLLEVVARGQVMHAITVESHPDSPLSRPRFRQDDGTTLRPHLAALNRRRQARKLNRATSPRVYVPWLLLALSISIGCAYLALSLVR